MISRRSIARVALAVAFLLLSSPVFAQSTNLEDMASRLEQTLQKMERLERSPQPRLDVSKLRKQLKQLESAVSRSTPNPETIPAAKSGSGAKAAKNTDEEDWLWSSPPTAATPAGKRAPKAGNGFDKRFGSTKPDFVFGVANFGNGGMVAVGARGRGISEDAWIFRLDAGGSLLWEKTFGGSDTDRAHAVAALPGDKMVIVGMTGSKGAGHFDGWVLCLDADGNLLWEKVLGTHANEELNDVKVLPNGQLLLAGRATYKDDVTQERGWFVRMDDSGKVLKNTTITDTDGSFTRIALAENGAILAGTTNRQSKGKTDFWLTRLSNKGVVWTRRFVSSQQDQLLGLLATPEGGAIISGISTVAGKNTGRILHLNSNGGVVWEKSFLSKSVIGLNWLPNGNLLATGGAGASKETLSGWFAELGADGRLVSEKTLAREQAQMLWSAAPRPRKVVVLIGLSELEQQTRPNVRIFTNPIGTQMVPSDASEDVPVPSNQQSASRSSQTLSAAVPGTEETPPSTEAVRLQMELEFWNAIKKSNDRTLFDAYLQRFPNGVFAPLAKIRLKKITSTIASDHEGLFWSSIAKSTDPADYQAYLETYPNGKFRPLAKLRLKKLSKGIK